jgi:hypothetical protein
MALLESQPVLRMFHNTGWLSINALKLDLFDGKDCSERQ